MSYGGGGCRGSLRAGNRQSSRVSSRGAGDPHPTPQLQRPVPSSMTPKATVTPRHAAMNLLARREHSLQELRRKLGSRYEADELESALLSLVQDKLQCDARFADSYTRERIRKGFGPMKISAELQRRGVRSLVVDQALNRVLEEGSKTWQLLAEQVLRQKYGVAPPVDFKEKGQRIRFLESRGFGQYLPPSIDSFD
ncbi:MAG: regulatory protein RecX [Pseudomonadota bacterium]